MKNKRSYYKLITVMFAGTILLSASLFSQSLAQDLISAVMDGEERAAIKLLKKGADPNSCTLDYSLKINLTLNNQNIVIKKELKKATALIIAIHRGYTNIALKLIEAGADVNLSYERECRPIVYASIFNRVLVVKKIIATGGIIGLCDMTSLMWASRLGNFEIVQLLVENRADVNEVNHMGASPLMFAVMSGNYNIVDFLIQKGAKINIKSRYGKTPLWLAKHLNKKTIYRLIKNYGGRL